MNRIKKGFQLIQKSIHKAVVRFPEAICIAFAFVITGIILNHHSQVVAAEHLMMVFALGAPLMAALTLVRERFMSGNRSRILTDIVGLGILVIYYFIIPEALPDAFMMQYFALMAIFYGAFALAPYFPDRPKLSQYALHLVGKFFVTFFYSLVLYLGTVATLFTVETLFELNLPSDIYFDVLLIAGGMFGVTHFLGNIPSTDKDLSLDQYSKVFKPLLLYIVLPLLTIYTVILHAYFIKLLVDQSLPQGVIGNLVVWYGLISTIALFFVKDLGQDLPWLKRFLKAYPFGLIIPLVMMFIAIGIRLSAYGITIPRYLVVMSGLFILIANGMMRFRKKDASALVASLAIICMGISFFGVLSANHLTLWSQTGHFERNLKAYNLMDDAGNLQYNGDLTDGQNQEVADQIRFLSRAYGLENIALLPEGTTLNSFETQTGVEVDYYYDNSKHYFSEYYDDRENYVDARGYGYVVKIENYNKDMTYDLAFTQGVSLSVSENGQVVDFTLGSDTSSLDLNDWVKGLIAESAKEGESRIKVGQVELKLKLSLISYSGSGDQETLTRLDGFRVYLLVGQDQ